MTAALSIVMPTFNHERAAAPGAGGCLATARQVVRRAFERVR